METVTRLGRHGRLVIPAAMRRHLKLVPGDEVVLREEEEGLRLLTVRQAVSNAQRLVRRHLRGRKSLVKELLASRRREARGG